ncbi:MAG: hypothetical protein K9H26_08455 [Prolixibacteraceae bacterium]|nr:hypothetical protein [Prolixibacteraceae bacterium]
MFAIIYLFSIFFSTEKTEFFRNEPVIFTINIDADSVKAEKSILNKKLYLEFKKESGKITDDQFNEQIEQTELTKDLFVVEDTINWKNKAVVEFFSNEEKKWIKPYQQLHLLNNKYDTTIINIEKNQTHYIDWGIDPEDVQKMRTGTYKARAKVIFKNTSLNQNDTIYSQSFSFLILNKYRPTNSPEYLKDLSIYYTRRGLYEKAFEYAEMYNDQSGDDYSGAILQAEIYELIGDNNKALELYMSLKNRSEDLPHQYGEYLNQKIQSILQASPESVYDLIEVTNE